MSSRVGSRRSALLLLLCAAGSLGASTFGVTRAAAAPPSIVGQATNFDVSNGTDKECEGFEVDIEDVNDTQVTYTWPGSPGYINPYGAAKSITNTTFPDGHTGVVVQMHANYVNGAWDAYTPIGQVNHYGVHVNGAPGTTTYTWLCDSGTSHSAGSTGTLLPYGGTTSGNYYPQPAPPSVVPTVVPTPTGEAVQTVVTPAETPSPGEGRLPDAIFIKRYEISSPNLVDVNNLLVTDPEVQRAMTSGAINSTPELFQPDPASNDGQETEPADMINPGDESSLMVTETYSYTGPVDPADNSATCNDIVGDPANCTNFVGPMIARQMESAQLVAATPNRHVLTVTTPLTGGSVTSDAPGNANPGAIDCPSSTCFTIIDPGTVMHLTAVPDASHDFAHWTGACTGTSPTCAVTMSASKTVKAIFKPAPKLRVVVKKHGSVSSDDGAISGCSNTCSAPEHRGAVVTLTATATPGQAFVHWAGACTGSSPTCTITMTGAKSATAVFN